MLAPYCSKARKGMASSQVEVLSMEGVCSL